MQTLKTSNLYRSALLLLLLPVIFLSCNLEDFNLKKIVRPNDIIPVYSAPIGYGTFKISDLAPAALPSTFLIPAGGLTLQPVVISKSGTSFTSAAIDSAYLVITFTNTTLCNIAFELSFINSSTGAHYDTFKANPDIPPTSKDYPVRFNLGPNDLTLLKRATDVELTFKLLPPSSGNLTYGALKSDTFTFSIFFYAPVNILKL